jgi:Pre ATP-grasp domain
MHVNDAGGRALLFLNNIDGGITCHGPATGPLAEKCFHIAARGSFYCGARDAIVQYRPTDPEFLTYCQEITGVLPRTFAPATLYESTMPLSLIELVERDSRLIETLRREGAAHDWAVCPFIHTDEVAAFAASLGLPVHGISPRVLASDSIARLNDKFCFQQACRRLDIPIPPSVYARGWHNLVAEATSAFSAHRRVKLRQARGAAGLGICDITPELLARIDMNDIGRYLEAVLHDNLMYWTDQVVLVEPMLPIVASPAVDLRVVNGEARIIAEGGQALRGGSFVGIVYPTELDRGTMHTIHEHSLRYAREHVLPLVGDDADIWFDIDWGVMPDGSVVAFESNCRLNGGSHILALSHLLFQETAHVAQSDDAIRIGRQTSFADVRKFLAAERIGWDALRRDGVVVTIPPSDGCMGVVCFARTHENAARLMDKINDFALTCRL